MSGSAVIAPFAFSAGSFSGAPVGYCSTTIVPATPCNVDIEFTPVLAQIEVTQNLLVNYNDGTAVTSSTLSIDGEGVNPALLTVSPVTTNNFGNVTVGATASLSFQVDNIGGTTATLMADNASLIAPFTYTAGSFALSGCAAGSLAAAANCVISIDYTPAGAGGDAGTLDIQYNDGFGLLVAAQAISGTALTPALLAINGSSTYDFGDLTVNASRADVIVVNNSGQSDSTLMVSANCNAS